MNCLDFRRLLRTDRSAEFHAAELIREKLTVLLRQELPYGLTVQIERYVKDEKGVVINAIVWVERSSQKGIVVGKQGGDRCLDLCFGGAGEAVRQRGIDRVEMRTDLDYVLPLVKYFKEREHRL